MTGLPHQRHHNEMSINRFAIVASGFSLIRFSHKRTRLLYLTWGYLDRFAPLIPGIDFRDHKEKQFKFVSGETFSDKQRGRKLGDYEFEEIGGEHFRDRDDKEFEDIE